ncbi:putative disease resistance protein rga4 [Quercus suber]|uniref:Disease resistance protein rga4 n=1 Tax=Quercus suber TaxID=58331 RepID=A0AAW0M1K0_QUESU
MVRKKDRFWEHAEDLNNGRFKCNFCKRDFAGGASRIKCHLAGVKGHDIDICTKVSKESENPKKKLKGASTSNRDKKREINSTSISKDVTLSRVFEKSNKEYGTEIVLSVAVEGLLAKVRSLVIDHIENKMKTIINRLLDTIKNGLRVGSTDTIPEISQDRGVDSYLNDLEIVGRGSDVSEIVNMLTNASNQCISILPIVGMAGLGKTTLAKEVYNNELIRKHFDVLAWLGLYWDKEEDYRDKDEKVLEGLQPHPNLKSLTIQWYGGKKFPSWVGLSPHHNLIEIKLGLFKNCEEVPTLGHLPCLRVLEIFGMEKVRCIGSEFYSDESCKNTILFPALRILKLEEMRVLEEWKDAKELTIAGEVLVFPCLEKLTLFDCPKLRYLPDSLNTCDSLQKLVVGCGDLRYLPGVPSSIIRSVNIWRIGILYLVYCFNLVHLPTKEAMQRLTQLKKLVISDCPKFEHNERIKISHVPCVEINNSPLTQEAGKKFAFGKIIKLMTTVAKAFQLSLNSVGMPFAVTLLVSVVDITKFRPGHCSFTHHITYEVSL